MITGAEFSGEELLEVNDISDWLVNGVGGEPAKAVLDDLGWDGEAVVGITIITSPDNRRVINSGLFMTGELMRNQKEVRANRIFGEADKEIRILYQIEDASIFTFRNGSPIGEMVNDDKISWSAVKKSSRGTTEIERADLEANKITGGFCIRPYVVPISATKAKLTLVVFPGQQEDLLAQHAHALNASFPGLELLQLDINLFPQMNEETGKSWGCPLIPLFHMGGSLEDYPNIPSTTDIKAAISATLRAALMPCTKRDIRSLAAAWTAIQEGGPTKLREKKPELLWPDWQRERRTQSGK